MAAIGFSGMMHGYMAFNKSGELLVPFRTWRNTITAPAAKELTKLFHFNIPQRWSIAHLYQAILNNEEHVGEIDFITTLAGYIHWQLTGRRVMGVGEASGMFPIDSKTKDFDQKMIDAFENKENVLKYPWKLHEILPKVLVAGEKAGLLTAEAAAMVHCNNCTSDLNAWVSLFKQFSELFGMDIDMNDLYGKLYRNALTGDKDCGGLLAFNCLSGEPVIGTDEGRPMFARKPDADMSLANFMRTHLYASLATLKIGCDILFKEEKVKVDTIFGHGGLFKTKGVGQSILAAAMDAPVAVMKTAGEGGPWGMAVLAAYMVHGRGKSLEAYLSEDVFDGLSGEVMQPDPEEVKGYDDYIKMYKDAVEAQKILSKAMKL